MIYTAVLRWGTASTLVGLMLCYDELSHNVGRLPHASTHFPLEYYGYILKFSHEHLRKNRDTTPCVPSGPLVETSSTSSKKKVDMVAATCGNVQTICRK